MPPSPPPKKPARKVKPKTPPPFDFGNALGAITHRSKDRHEAAAMFANAKGTWMVTPHTHTFEGKGAEKRARAYFESLRTACPVTGTRKEAPNAASKAPAKGKTKAKAQKAEINR